VCATVVGVPEWCPKDGLQKSFFVFLGICVVKIGHLRQNSWARNPQQTLGMPKNQNCPNQATVRTVSGRDQEFVSGSILFSHVEAKLDRFSAAKTITFRTRAGPKKWWDLEIAGIPGRSSLRLPGRSFLWH